jgi:exodeoxyribonuclease VII large subunit
MTIYSVSEFIHGINELLTNIPVCVQGEVSNFRLTQNRFVWFDLKDDKSCVSCFMLAFQLNQPLNDGMMVQVSGYPSLFSKSGRFHVRAQRIQLVGDGSLKQSYELLKAKLAAEGLFAPERKRLLPRFAQRIGLVTSSDAAAFTDVQRILRNRWAGLEIKHFPVQVQGEQAVRSIVQALQQITAHWKDKLDVVIITRGGGSMEDLQAFNDEAVVRAIFALPIPSVAAIGHERDHTLAEDVADVRASTPSNAAEMVVPDKRDVQYQIDALMQFQAKALQRSVNDLTLNIRDCIDILDDQAYHYIQSIQELTQKFMLHSKQWEYHVKLDQTRVDQSLSLLQSYSPIATLKRGYSITQLADGTIVESTKQVTKGKKLVTQVADGIIDSTVL